MKAHLITVLVIDHEDAGHESCAQLVAIGGCVNAYPIETKTADIGEWSDDHPLNQTSILNDSTKVLAYFDGD